MSIATTPFDPADYLTDGDGIEEYLRSAFETEHVSAITDALGVVARARGMTALAQDTGLTRQSLYKALGKDGNPGFETVMRIAHALGFRLTAERLPA
jgi:probable addiction module antidote protein